PLTLFAVRDVVVDPILRVFDYVAVAGRDADDAQLAGPFQGPQVGRHVAAGRSVDHRVHAIEHGVAREQHALFLEHEAQVIRGVTRSVEHLETELGALDRIAFADDSARRHRYILLRKGQHLGARLLHEPGDAGRVIGVRMGQQDPAHPFLHRRADDGVDVVTVVRTRVDDRDFVDAYEVGVGARAGERP